MLTFLLPGEPTNTDPSETTDTTTTSTTGTSTSDPTDTTTTKPTSSSTIGPDVGAAAPESGSGPKQKQQGADRPTEEPTGEQVDAVKDEKDEAEGAMEKDPNDHSGQPLGQAGKDDKGDSSQKDSMGSTSKEPGTGEKYVKSTGVAAEGGDFDATNPGAGREADRTSSIPCAPLH